MNLSFSQEETTCVVALTLEVAKQLYPLLKNCEQLTAEVNSNRKEITRYQMEIYDLKVELEQLKAEVERRKTPQSLLIRAGLV